MTARVVGVGVQVAALGGERAEVGEGVEDRQHVGRPIASSVVQPPASRRRSSTSKPSTDARTSVEPVGGLVGRSASAARSMRSVTSRSASRVADRLDPEQRRAGVDLHVAGDEDVAHPAARPGPRWRSPSSSPRRRPGGSPASTMSSGATSTPTTSAAAGARTMPASSREKRWATPSTSIRWSLPWVEDTTREAAPADREAAAGSPQPLDVDDDRHAVELDLVPGRPDPPDGDAARLPAVAQLDLATDLGVRLRSAAARPARGTSARSSAAWSSLASMAAATRATSASRVGRCSSAAVSRSSHAVSTSPARTSGRSRRSRRNDLLVVPPRTSTVVCDSARCRRASASSRLRPVGDDLGDHRVVLRRDHVTLGDAGVDAEPGPDGERQRLDRARARGRRRAAGPRR